MSSAPSWNVRFDVLADRAHHGGTVAAPLPARKRCHSLDVPRRQAEFPRVQLAGDHGPVRHDPALLLHDEMNAPERVREICSVNSASLFLQAASNRSRSAAISSARRSSLATRRTIAMKEHIGRAGPRTCPSQPASGLVARGGLVFLPAYRVGCCGVATERNHRTAVGSWVRGAYRSTLDARRGEPSLRFQNKKVSARATALALVLGVVGVLVTALPASASTITSFTPTCGIAGTVVTINGAGFTGMTDVLFNGTSSTGEVFVTDAQVTATVPAGVTAGPITVETRLPTPRVRRTSSRGPRDCRRSPRSRRPRGPSGPASSSPGRTSVARHR